MESNTLREEITRCVLSYYDNDVSCDKAVDGLIEHVEDVLNKFEQWKEFDYLFDNNICDEAPPEKRVEYFLTNIYKGK